MSSKKCCVSGCLNSFPKAPKGTTWHPFPKNENLAKEWMAKISTNAEKRRNSLVCSDHFDKKDFKTKSHNLRNRGRILSSSAVPLIFKSQKDKKTKTNKGNLQIETRSKRSSLNVEQKLPTAIAEVDVSSEIDKSVLPLDVWEKIFSYLSLNDLIALSSTCKYSQRIVQTLLNKADFSNYYPFNWNGFLSYTLSTTCTSINLNHCYWLKPSEILEMISKTNLEHLHIIECKVDRKCIEAICDLELTSLSISYATDWRLFFKKRKTNDVIRGFLGLKNLEIFYKQFPSEILIEIYSKMLVNCEGLEHLKVFQCISQSILSVNEFKYEEEDDQIPLEPTLVPELKSLVINLQSVWFQPNVEKFIALILKDKVVPLQRVDFGHQTGYLFKKNILPHPKIMLDKSILSISCINTDLNFWLNFPSVQELINQPDYKSVEIRNVEMDGFYEFAQKIASNSRKTLNKVQIKHRHIFYNCYLGFLDGLSHIAFKCPQITVFDFTGHAFESNEDFFYISNVTVRKHKALLNALVNLKNLKKLAIPASILHCKYYKSNGVKLDKALPFWKVTTACKSITEIRITFSPYFLGGLTHQIHESSLYCIASCAQLRTLHLTRFQIQCAESSKFVLSRISKSCGQLRELYIRDIQSLSNHSDIFSKNMKIISSFGMQPCDKAFLNDLSRCQDLEKLYLDWMLIEEEDFELLEDVLRKLKNLKAFVVRHRVRHLGLRVSDRELKKSRNERLDCALKSIADERPGFFYTLKGFDRNRMPSVHLDALYHDGLNDYYIGNAH